VLYSKRELKKGVFILFKLFEKKNKLNEEFLRLEHNFQSRKESNKIEMAKIKKEFEQMEKSFDTRWNSIRRK